MGCLSCRSRGVFRSPRPRYQQLPLLSAACRDTGCCCHSPQLHPALLALVHERLIMLWIVLSNDFRLVSPESTGWNKSSADNYVRFTKPHFDEADREYAVKFAEWMSERLSQRYYLCHVEDFCQPVKPPVKWHKSERYVERKEETSTNG